MGRKGSDLGTKRPDLGMITGLSLRTCTDTQSIVVFCLNLCKLDPI